jgi:hypothetical protein
MQRRFLGLKEDNGEIRIIKIPHLVMIDKYLRNPLFSDIALITTDTKSNALRIFKKILNKE